VQPPSDDLEKALIALGRAIYEARREKKLTQEELALRTNLHVTYIGIIERGRRNPTWGTVRRISLALGVRLSEMARRAEEFERGERGD
jgi:transcriptional regulator with XRE-family HTH domain